VPKEHIKEIIRLGTLAPSAHNSQKWLFKAVYNHDLNVRIAKSVLAKIDALVERYEIEASVKGWKYYSSFFSKAPVVIYAFYSHSKGFLEEYAEGKLAKEELEYLRLVPGVQSVGAAIENILLAAVSMGYGACWMTAPIVAAGEIEQILDMDEGFKLAAVIPVGVPFEVPGPRPRKELNQVMEIIE